MKKVIVIEECTAKNEIEKLIMDECMSNPDNVYTQISLSKVLSTQSMLGVLNRMTEKRYYNAGSKVEYVEQNSVVFEYEKLN